MSSIDIDTALICPICIDTVSCENAVETCCCHQLYCGTCIENINVCPSCRQDKLKTVPAHFARRLIGSLTIQCPNQDCNEQVTRSNLANHLKQYCAHRSITCPDPKCQGFQCTRNTFARHLIDKHEKYLIDNFEKLCQQMVENGGSGVILEPTQSNTTRVTSAAAKSLEVNDDRIETAQNIFGRNARLGSSGKFYCSGALDGLPCTCCNGRCGPTNGCNCSGCMLLDVQKRKLPHGWLVNRDGASARRSQITPENFYCGRMVMLHVRSTDGYCGPTNGEQCFPCKQLNQQQNQRYRAVWANTSSP